MVRAFVKPCVITCYNLNAKKTNSYKFIGIICLYGIKPVARRYLPIPYNAIKSMLCYKIYSYKSLRYNMLHNTV